jgi:hypothetical protein
MFWMMKNRQTPKRNGTMHHTTTRPAAMRPELLKHFAQCEREAREQIARIFAESKKERKQ